MEQPNEDPIQSIDDNQNTCIVSNERIDVSTPKVVFIVPYRDRKHQYEVFDNHMRTTVLKDYQETYYKIIYVHQNDNRVFNRGALKNLGFIFVKQLYPETYRNITLVFNDIDTTPNKSDIIPNYETEKGIVKHFFGVLFALGGIFAINAGDFEDINGFPNYWSWGFEDNLLYQRVQSSGLTLDRSVFYYIKDTENISQGQNGTFRTLNRMEFDRYIRNVSEGIDSLYSIEGKYDPVSGFVNVTKFLTGYDHQPYHDVVYDITKGNTPFKVGFSSRKRCKMNMVTF